MLNGITEHKGHYTMTAEHGVEVLTIVNAYGSCLAVQRLKEQGKTLWRAILKIQEWLRHRRQKSVLLAVAMSLHDRLGELAGLGLIGQDNMEIVARFTRA